MKKDVKEDEPQKIGCLGWTDLVFGFK